MFKKVFTTLILLFFLSSQAWAYKAWRYREHATDCTALTDGKESDICRELDSERWFGCYPSSGDCDTAGEWVLINSPTATTSVSGTVILATSAETTSGTEESKVVTPDGFAGSNYGKATVSIKLTEDGGDALTTGDGKFYYLVPAKLNGMNLVAVEAGVSTVSSSGAPEFQIHNLTDTQDMLSTTLTIDASEYHSSTAATAAVINTSYDDVATGDRLRIDVDTAGTGTKGVQIDLTFQLP